ncbi:MAG: FAD-binding oxidoreductase [Betaproteobacteria bacterium]|nr:MAG: FAD-binding oxidoreductase [Betaproteobacteria bacterium]
MSTTLLSALRETLGERGMITDPAEKAPYCVDWRKKYVGDTLAVCLPSSALEVAALVRQCAEFNTAIVPQGGNTGMSGAATPDSSGKQIVVSMKRLNRVRAVDTANYSITVEAGVILQTLQDEAAKHDRLFPLAIGSQGSCMIGGNLASNAGGTAVLRYGNARELCLGIEAVLPNGEIVNALQGLRKNNVGYSLRDLLIGSEGTLGIITAATMKLFPRPKAQVTAWIALESMDDAIALFQVAFAKLGAMLTAFELIHPLGLEMAERSDAVKSFPLPRDSANWFVLMEASDGESEAHATAAIEVMLGEEIEAGRILDVAVAGTMAQSQSMWAIREAISVAQSMVEGPHIKHDISVPISRFAEFHRVTFAALSERYSGIRVNCFGHIGDGNLHYNVFAPLASDQASFGNVESEAINRIVHDRVVEFGGSISAEHGIGQLRRDELAHYGDPASMQAMRAIKQALDPKGLFNPGKVI